MQIEKSQTTVPLIRMIARAFDYFKDVRARTPLAERRWYMPAPAIVWHAESIADLQREMGNVECGDLVALPKARWWPARGEYEIRLQDDSGNIVIPMRRNPIEPVSQFSRPLLLVLQRAPAGCELFDIRLWMDPVFELAADGLPKGKSIGSVLALWDAHLNKGERTGYDPVKGLRAQIEMPDNRGDFLK